MPPRTRVTLEDVAAKAGVAPITVSRALRGHPHVVPQLMERIQRLAHEMGYRPNASAALLRSLRNPEASLTHLNLACLLGHKEWNPLPHIEFYREIYRGIESRSRELGCSIEAFWTQEPGMTAARLNGVLHARGIAGLCLLAMFHEEIDLEWERYACACVSNSYLLYQHPFHFVATDKFHTALRGVEYLLSQGHERVGMCFGENKPNLLTLRSLAGYRLEMQLAHKSTVPPLYLDPMRLQDAELQEKLHHWMEKHHLDAVCFSGSELHDRLKQFPSPGPVLFCLDLPSERTPFAGMLPPYQEMGEVTVDLILNQLHRNRTGFVRHARQRILLECGIFEPGKGLVAGPPARPSWVDRALADTFEVEAK